MTDDITAINKIQEKIREIVTDPVRPNEYELGSVNIMRTRVSKAESYLKACVDFGILSDMQRKSIRNYYGQILIDLDERGIFEANVTSMNIPRIYLNEKYVLDGKPDIPYKNTTVNCKITTEYKTRAEEIAEEHKQNHPDSQVVIALIPAYAVFWDK